MGLEKYISKVVGALLTIAWASTKQRDVSQTEIRSVYRQFEGDA